MIHVSGRRLVAAFIFSPVAIAFLFWFSTVAASPLPAPGAAELDHLIPREKWDATGLNKLTAPEQQTLANEITGLVGAAQTAGAGANLKDMSQWRQLKRHMSKDDVRRLLGDPARVSVSRFYEAWYYLNSGSVTFDGKGHVDSWSEL